jgi:hypothetical protein
VNGAEGILGKPRRETRFLGENGFLKQFPDGFLEPIGVVRRNRPMVEQQTPVKPFQVEQVDLDKLVEVLREAGRPMSIEELTQRYVFLLRDRVTSETTSA